ncbi:hypothetical protein ACFQ71_41890 [Streptomyces sp. NPDC056534]|uniref:hypothetical protein n=1 Tax=Streptomyces sp. NPDC056534 TaxID=3345857 RepID=UPI0036B59CDD
MRADRTAAAPALRHVRYLIARRPDLPVAAIARHAGVASSTLKSLLSDAERGQGEGRTVSLAIARRLLALQVADLPGRERGYGGRSTDAAPAMEHVGALLAAHPALSQAALARAAGMSPSTLVAALHDVAAGRPRRIQQAAARQLLALDPDLLLTAAAARRKDTMELGPVIDHLHALQLRYDRASRAFIARTAGVNPSTLACALLDHSRNPRRGIHTAVGRRILALEELPPPACPRRTQVTDTGLLRRLRALCAAGWTLGDIGAAGNISAKTLTAFATSHHPRGTPALRGAVLAGWEELSHRPGPSPAARSRAQSKGWAPPLAWDNETIDDPATPPSGIRNPGHQPPWDPDLLQHELRFLTRLGLSKAQALKRLGLGNGRAHRILIHSALAA